MKSGLTLYTANLHPLVNFYSQILPIEIREQDETFVALESGDFELVILQTETAKAMSLSTNPVRETVALKPVFFIAESFEDIRPKIENLGGGLQQPKNWLFNGWVACDGWDCDGNVFQLRSRPK